MKLFVAKLNREVTDEHLKELFSQYGSVDFARVITDRETGDSKCFGFVTMADQASGQAAMDALNGQEYMRFRMVVKVAEDRQGGGGQTRPSGKDQGDRGSRRENESSSRSSAQEGSRGLSSDRAQDPGEFSRLNAPAPGRGTSRFGNKKKSDGKGRSRDIYQDGPSKPSKTKRSKPKNPNWLDDLDFE